jgi:hypothetical protein
MGYDIFNGDADGICALHMLRMATPAQRTLITGVKRDIALLRHVPDAPDPDLLVLDISLDANAVELDRLLANGASITWFDHHAAERATRHPRLNLHHDDSPDVCTSILVDRQQQGRYRPWAVVAAFGDNLAVPAQRLAHSLHLSADDCAALAQLGQTLNYNAYGECEAICTFRPPHCIRPSAPARTLRTCCTPRSTRPCMRATAMTARACRACSRTGSSTATPSICCPTRRGHAAPMACWPTAWRLTFRTPASR